MNIILSASAWYNFIVDRLAFDALFIPVSILIVFALFNSREYKNVKVLRFILTALAVTLVSRYMYFVFMETKINTRYLFTAAFYIIILCVPGFMLIMKLLKKLTRQKEKYLISFLVLIIAAGSIWKTLGSVDKKEYITGTAKIVKVSAPAVLISNLHDSRRVAWHAKAELIPLASIMDTDNPGGADGAMKVLSSKNKNFFLLVNFKDNEFRKIFSDKKVSFPERLVFLKEFKARHRKFYALYKVKHIEQK